MDEAQVQTSVLTLAAPQPYYDMILEGNARALFGEKVPSQK